MSDFVRVLAATELAPGQCREVAVEGKPVALYNIDGTFFATGNLCLHRGGPLGQGMVEGRTIMCPWHAWTWDVATGENTANAELKIPCYEVRVEDGHVLVKVG
ncbi:MAG TPA: Rieske 2Fe-2S domain-containing protein [Vicinamibacteria bacterium]|jgi:nitrite reductase/ring-hydroxylating ferredoxin subunit